MSKQHATIAIGRNIGDSPMSSTAWAHFQLAIHQLACAYGTPVYEVQGVSHSKYGHEATLITSVELDPLQDLDYLRQQLSELSLKYHQEAIALTIGPPAELIKADSPFEAIGYWKGE